jgi:E3 ubiquitin-protein ligase synoviolin
MPYLTLPGSDLLAETSSQAVFSLGRVTRQRGREQPTTLAETRDALEERLRLLREVDEVVWGLVGELSSLQSGWAREEGSETEPGRPDA